MESRGCKAWSSPQASYQCVIFTIYADYVERIVPFMLRNIWTAGLVLFGLIMGSTFFITKVWQVSEYRPDQADPRPP